VTKASTQAATATAAGPTLAELYASRPRSRFIRVSACILLGLVATSWFSGVIEWADLFSERRASNLERFLSDEATPKPLRSAQPEESLGQWFLGIWSSRGASGTLATFWISWAAMTLAAIFALLVTPWASRALMKPDPYLRRHVSAPYRAAVQAVRLACVLLRAVPEYIWAFLLLAILGPTAWPAVLALAIHNAGILGRLSADVADNLSPRPGEALRQLGATRSQLAASFFFPQAFSRFVLFFFYRFESCVREATVLGMLGILSLGYWIQDAHARERFDEMILLVLFGAALVLAVDLLSWWARAWLRRAGLSTRFGRVHGGRTR